MRDKERWEIDAGHSQLGFSLRHIVVSEIQGFFRSWGGGMLFDPGAVSRTQIQVWIDVDSIDTGAPERDAHVRSAEFLDAPQFPRALFTSTEIAVRDDGEALVTGRLQLHGITRVVELRVVAQRTWVDGDGLMRAAYQVQGQIDRQDFGLHWNQDLDVGGIVVGDRVQLDARVELVRAAHADRAAGAPDRDSGAPAPPT